MLILEDDAIICPNFLSRARKLIESVERAVPAAERTVLLYLGGDLYIYIYIYIYVYVYIYIYMYIYIYIYILSRSSPTQTFPPYNTTTFPSLTDG